MKSPTLTLNHPHETKVLDHGIISLTDVMGWDSKPAERARTSYGNSAAEKTPEENEKLIAYLLKNKHTTPFEFCQLEFYAVMPIFVARQWVRHRTASINEESLRYIEARDQFYLPNYDRMQKKSKTSKQGSSTELIDDPKHAKIIMDDACHHSFNVYSSLLSMGLSNELARGVLPLNTYTAWYWRTDLHNLLHFLDLRLHSHAQYEIRVYAEAMLEQVKPYFPSTFKAWEAIREDKIYFEACLKEREERIKNIKPMELG